MQAGKKKGQFLPSPGRKISYSEKETGFETTERTAEFMGN